jgi:hypothetical protein
MNHLTLLKHRSQQNNGNGHDDGYGVQIDRLPAQSVVKLTRYLKGKRKEQIRR